MQLSLCADFPNLVQLRVVQVLPHLIILARLDENRLCEMWYLLTPDLRPEASCTTTQFDGIPLPLIFHSQGQFYLHDQQTMRDINLLHLTQLNLDQLDQLRPQTSYFPYRLVPD